MMSVPNKSIKRNSGEQTVYLRGSLNLSSKDDAEGSRLIFQHRLLASVARKQIYFAHLQNPHAILDVASGTGVWGFEMAQRFKQATVTNLDINGTMGRQWLNVFCARRPDLQKRLRFVEADALQPLPFEDHAFDFVHGRLLGVFVPYSDWPRVVRELVRVTKPGGWVELAGGEYPELDMPAFAEMRAAVIRFLGSLHLHLNASAHYPEFLEEAGVEKIKCRMLRVGARPSHRAKLADNFVTSAQALRGPMIAARCIAPETFDTILPAFRHEILESEMIWNVRACWGQKPMASNTPGPTS
jgi:ubiquinone/menaquinone biosynthesis C-methylase UbiE